MTRPAAAVAGGGRFERRRRRAPWGGSGTGRWGAERGGQGAGGRDRIGARLASGGRSPCPGEGGGCSSGSSCCGAALRAASVREHPWEVSGTSATSLCWDEFWLCNSWCVSAGLKEVWLFLRGSCGPCLASPSCVKFDSGWKKTSESCLCIVPGWELRGRVDAGAGEAEVLAVSCAACAWNLGN